MLLENYVDLGVLLQILMRVSEGKTITFSPGYVIVQKQDGTIQEKKTGSEMITINTVEIAIEAATI